MADLRLQHRLHHVGHRPHALADLRLAAETAGQADADIAILIGGDPVRRLHLALGDHRARAHRGVDLVARTVEEAGVDEDDAVLYRFDARPEVGAVAPFLVYPPIPYRYIADTVCVGDK